MSAVRDAEPHSYVGDFFQDVLWKEATEAFKGRRQSDVSKGKLRNFLLNARYRTNDFLSDSTFMQELRDHLLEREDLFSPRNNDLFQFMQTPNLLKSEERSVPCIRDDGESTGGAPSVRNPVNIFGDILRAVIKPVLERVSGIDLSDDIFMSSSIYTHTDTLLCHDDDLEERRLAFIYYLTPPEWTEEDGGQLDLFECTDEASPGKVVRSFLPKRNTFLFFHVSYRSFHQVREILTKTKVRLSLNGWFNGAPLKRPPHPIDALPSFVHPGNLLDEFFEWINPTYLDPETIASIQENFEETSEIQLVQFFNAGVYDELCSAFLAAADEDWLERGPANRRKFRNWNRSDVDDGIIGKLQVFFHSEAFFLLLSQLTGLQLHRKTEEDSAPSSSKKIKVEKESCDPGCFLEIREMEHGSYSLCSDEDPVMSLNTLEASVFFNSPASTEDDDGDEDEPYDGPGGFLSYVPRFETNEMLRISPARNTLSLVYRTSDVLRFTKRCSKSQSFYSSRAKASQARFWEYYAVFPDFVKTLHVECNVLLPTKFGAKGVKTEFCGSSLISEEQGTDQVAVAREETGVRIRLRRGKKRKSYVKTKGVEATELQTSPVVVGPSDGSEESVPPAKSPRIEEFSVFDENKSRNTDGVVSQPVHLFEKGENAGKEVKRRGLPPDRRQKTSTYSMRGIGN
ncbi:unnamed protein product [Notodromas monacha]|uniref:uS12 prolyl 3-hydroxylase n=1 Tax=Notodromas monacha TaxID=399045 RepID=A0A7R9BV04_9CRUS|nr:unnamed protein product [Notodromas monacha]CAG0920723.1 unnamed protein product [Notodromas monacha]